LRFYRRGHRRVAVSELIGAVLAIAITLIAGAATWSFVRSQAVVSEGAIQGNGIATNNLLSGTFAVEDMYFGTSTTATFMIYNTGSLTFQVGSVRLYDSAGLMNVFYNYASTGAAQVAYVSDLRSASPTQCQTSASTYESPQLGSTTVFATNSRFYTLTIPSASGGCPSFGQPFTAGTTYTVVVTATSGNVETFSQEMIAT
jgi:hypothetical protein